MALIEMFIGNYKLSDVIPMGESNAISKKRLSEKVGLDGRTVIECIHKARESGIPVCSSNNGYYMPKDINEAIAFIKRQAARVSSGRASLKPVIDYVKRSNAREVWEQLEEIAENI